ncbi:NUDIX hydrolase [Actinokineospora iranica]|uniref:Mutator mutT protein n=1 Tax=Actinokineospora iranica TaxID=1271860 RepID=A0A1G6R4C4_9PSEU|nr:NUDIX domain-containing protein [Actinokineospora iranica]SDC99378.1 mutator mutT protein [Actinokineospora iranica]
MRSVTDVPQLLYVLVWASDIRKIRCVGGIVRDSTGRVLLVRRARDPGRGLWSLPGGKVERGETDPEAVVREIREETGLTVAVGDLVGTVERPGPRGVFEIHDYACTVTDGDLVAGDDALEARWADLAIFTTLERANALVEALFQTLETWGALPR